MERRVSELISCLERHNITAAYANDRDVARETVMGMIPVRSTVGFGDSLTLRQIGVVEALENGDYTFLNPWTPEITAQESLRLKRRALVSDVFVTGTNAVTLDGTLVNVDGHGNRVAAMLFGPAKVIVVVGTNKIVANLDEALNRIRTVAAPRNVKRHSEFDPPPPCSETGICSDCVSPWRICNKTVIIERQYHNERYERVLCVVIVGEELGL